jgi:hypothetical protein
MNPAATRLSLATLGVSNLARSIRFYEDIGFFRKARSTGDRVAFFDAGGAILSLPLIRANPVTCRRGAVCPGSRHESQI